MAKKRKQADGPDKANATTEGKKKRKGPPKRICASAARSQYGLTERDLAPLECKLRDNPVCADYAPMRMYLEEEIKALAEAKQARLAYEREHAEEIAAAKAEARAEAARERRQQARDAVKSFKLPTAAEAVLAGSTPLPEEIWAAVFTHLASTLEPPGGVRGPGVVAADMVRAGLACRDMCRAAQTGLQALAERVTVRTSAPPLPALDTYSTCPHAKQGGAGAYAASASASDFDWSLWKGLLCRPMERKVPELQGALRQLRPPVSGNKPELVLRLLEHFGLKARCTVPGRLWVALQQERNGQASPLSAQLAAALRDLHEMGHPAAVAARRQPHLAGERAQLAAAFGNSAGLLAAHVAALPALLELRRVREERHRQQLAEERAERARQFEEEQKRRQARSEEQQRAMARSQEERAAAVHGELASRRAALGSAGGVLCPCGNCAAASCSLLLCGNCCRTYRTKRCPRHGG